MLKLVLNTKILLSSKKGKRFVVVEWSEILKIIVICFHNFKFCLTRLILIVFSETTCSN